MSVSRKRPVAHTDHAGVSIDCERDIKYWTAHFNVTDFRLWEALTAVGDDPGDVYAFLNEHAATAR